jgi:hypothetical protein
MIARWLNYIFHLSSYIYKKKDELLTKSISACLVNAIIIIFLEIYLSIISLPIFLFVPEKHIKSKYKGEETGFLKLYFANFILITGIILIIISFYSISIIFPSAILILTVVATFLFFLYAIHSKTWTEITFKTSNYLFSQKQKLIECTTKLRSVILSIYIVILELFLLFISLPVYVFIKPEMLKEINGEKFKLRRKLTLIYLGFFIFVILFQTIIAMMIVYNIYPPRAVSFN